MAQADVAALLRQAMVVMLELGGPPLLAALAAGLLISLLQAIMQISESTLVFVPKVLALCGVLVLMGPFMFAVLSNYTHLLFDRLIVVGGS